MKTTTVIYIIVVLTIIIILFYYLWYISVETDKKKDIPHSLLYKHEQTITDLMKDISNKYGIYPALKKKTKGVWKTISYLEYYQISDNFAEKLLYYIGPRPRIAILSFNRPEWFYAHMGTMISGGISVGIYPTISASNCESIIKHSHIDLLVVENIQQLAKFTKIKVPSVKCILILDPNDIFDKDNALGCSEDVSESVYTSIKKLNPMLKIISYETFINHQLESDITYKRGEMCKSHPEDIALVLYTANTSGEPKGVVITHSNIICSVKSILNAIRSRSNITMSIQESYISYLPLNRAVVQIMDIYIPLASVGIVYFAEKDAIDGTIKDTIKEVRPTIFIGFPKTWEKIYETIKEKQQDPRQILNKIFGNKMIVKDIGLNKAKFCITLSAPMVQKTRDFFNDLGIELCDFYAMSETTGPISMGVPGCSHGMGVPLIDIKFDKNTREILVKGNLLFKAYYNNKPATNKAFNSKGWFKTGDIGYIDRDGSLHMTIIDAVSPAIIDAVSPAIIDAVSPAIIDNE